MNATGPAVHPGTRRASDTERLETLTHDYIIVGTGAAGAVLADRLSESGEHSVLILEAGGSDRDLTHLVPKGWVFTMQNDRYVRRYYPEPFGDDRVEQWPRGLIDGGSTTVNGLGWNTGEAPAYDWEALGNEGWNWKAFRAALDRIENRGQAGPGSKPGKMHVESVNTRDELGDAFITALADQGVTTVDDANLAQGDRASYASTNTRAGMRWSASAAFLRPAVKRKNVTKINHAEVLRVIFKGTTAIGVEAEIDGRLQTFVAGREVIVCAGSLESPMILERSGIGQRDVLAAAGIDLIAESPKVGENLSEHRGISIMFRLNEGLGFNHQLSTPFKQLISGAKYLLTRKGVISSGSFDAIAMVTLDKNSPGVDTQLFATAISYGENMQPEKEAGGLIGGYPMYPTSRGSIHITGPRSTDKPKIITGYFETEYDRQMIVKATRKMREIIASPAMQELGAQEFYPGPNVQTDEEIVHHALNFGPFGYHTLGTCAIGPNDDDAVDNRLRVRGVNALRVVDASIFPHQPSGNNNGPTSAAAWIAADMILEDAKQYAIAEIELKPVG
jgi:choline dehydrogenase